MLLELKHFWEPFPIECLTSPNSSRKDGGKQFTVAPDPSIRILLAARDSEQRVLVCRVGGGECAKVVADWAESGKSSTIWGLNILSPKVANSFGGAVILGVVSDDHNIGSSTKSSIPTQDVTHSCRIDCSLQVEALHKTGTE